MPDDGFLHRYFLNNSSHRLHKWLHYFDIYERHFARFRERPIHMLEIGVHGGGSLAMWKEYFHPESQIIGIDILPKCKIYEANGVDIHIGSQDDADFLAQVTESYPAFDIVVDDGSHVNAHVITSFDVLYPRMSPRGVYLVEDMHTSYWPKWGGGLRREGTFIEFAKNKIDALNAAHIKEDYPVSGFTRSTDSICFYDSIVVFERRPQAHRKDLITTPMP